MLNFFEVDVQQGGLKILELFPQILILLFLEKMISPTMSKTTQFDSKNTRNCRG
jgi:hypothetical protein